MREKVKRVTFNHATEAWFDCIVVAAVVTFFTHTLCLLWLRERETLNKLGRVDEILRKREVRSSKKGKQICLSAITCLLDSGLS